MECIDCQQDAAGDYRLCRQCRHLANSTIHLTSNWCCHLANWTNILVFFYTGLFSALYEKMTSSTKPEVHNISHCRQRMTEPRPQVICIENLVKFGNVCLRYASRQTARQTNRHTDTLMTILRTPTGDEVITRFVFQAILI